MPKPKPFLNKQFVGTVEIGKTYLDSWAHIHTIGGYVVLSRGFAGAQDNVDKKRVWAHSGYHFFTCNGKSTHNGPGLVQLPPKEEKEFWQALLKQIRAVNSPENLQRVSYLIEKMEEKIELLNENRLLPPSRTI